MGSGASKQPKVQRVDLTGVDFNTVLERPVKDFPHYATRLSPIDYTSIIRQGRPFEDPYFGPHTDSLLDGCMMHPERNKKWSTFSWKRPAEVYGEGNFTLFDNITPSDIK